MFKVVDIIILIENQTPINISWNSKKKRNQTLITKLPNIFVCVIQKYLLRLVYIEIYGSYVLSAFAKRPTARTKTDQKTFCDFILFLIVYDSRFFLLFFRSVFNTILYYVVGRRNSFVLHGIGSRAILSDRGNNVLGQTGPAVQR